MITFIFSGTKLTKSLGPYTVPEKIADSLDFITGAIGFPRIRTTITKNTPQLKVRDDFDIGPADLRNRYNVSADAIGKNPQNRQAVAEFQDQYYSQTDLNQFFQQFVTFGKFNTSVKIVGYNDPTNPGIEANLDIQVIGFEH